MTVPPLISLAHGRRVRTLQAMKVRPKEIELHMAVAGLLRRFARPDWRWGHYPAGEHRDVRTAAKLKAMGTQAGWPDLILFDPEGRLHALELKPQGKHLTDEQKAFASWCAERGIPHVVARTPDEAIKIIDGWGALRIKDRGRVLTISSDLISDARDTDILGAARRVGAQLKRITATEWAGPCPNCGGTDRFAVNTKRQVFNCRGFGGGDVIGMVQHALGLDFLGAVEFIAGRRNEVSVQVAQKLRREQQQPCDQQDREPVDDCRPLWLWRQRQPITSSPAERYLREARGYEGSIPTTLGYLPPRHEHPSALIAAFGLATEPEPGVLAINDTCVKGVHLTRLNPDGSGKAGTDADKIIVGQSLGSPIVLAPPNDGLGLAITEGIEDALSIHQATGLGAWAAGSAGRLPALADAIPAYIDSVTVIGHRDAAGERGAMDLVTKLRARGFDTRLTFLGSAAAA
jgi:hypothetical protein